MLTSCLYSGEVVHRRLSPIRHELRYTVFNLFADVDRLSDTASSLRLFSYNRLNLFSIMDRNHGKGDGTPIAQHAWSLVREVACGPDIKKIFMFCYPSILGYVFNPLTVYYGFDADERLRVMIYEVNNTFGGRHSYVIPFQDDASQKAPKHFFVSPFNAVEGEYLFHVSVPQQKMALGVALTANGKPVLKAYVTGVSTAFTDANLIRSFLSVPFLTIKIIGAIHWEAFRLWRKGLRPKRRPQAQNHTVDVLPGGTSKS